MSSLEMKRESTAQSKAEGRKQEGSEDRRTQTEGSGEETRRKVTGRRKLDAS